MTPSSIEETDGRKEITSNINTSWSRYQPIDSESNTLYVQPHINFKWLHFLQTEAEKKALITEEVPETVTYKAYVYRKLKELSFAASLNRKNNQPLIFGKKLQKIQSYKSTISNFVNTVKARIRDGIFCSVKKSVQIDAQAFWKLAKEYGIEDYPKGFKNEEMLFSFYYKLFDFSKVSFRTRKSLSNGRKTFK
ncbi:hypothetical protein F4703DRAFT_1792456 [Phycomyces blakesleeanus]